MRSPLMGAAFADFAPLLLDLLEDCPLNDRFVDILEDDPVLPVIGKALLVLVRLGIGLEIEDVAAILLKGKDAGDSGAVPHTGIAQFTLSWAIDALLTPVSDGGEDFLLGQFCGDLLCSIALQGHAVNPVDYLGCLLIHDPPFRIIRVLFVAVGRRSHRLAGVALDLVADSALLADVAGVPLVEQVADGRQLVLALGGVDIVRNRHQADVVLREKFLGQPPHLDVVAAQPGKVFHEHGGGFACGKLLHHVVETGTVHGHTGDAVVQKMDQVGVSFLLRHFGQQFLLESDLSRVFSPRYITLYQKAK